MVLLSYLLLLSSIGKVYKQSKCPSVDDWIKKMWYMHTIKYYSALIKEEISSQVMKEMNHGDIMLSEISQTQKEKYCWISLV